MRSKVFLTMAVGLALSACAGRDPEPIASGRRARLEGDAECRHRTGGLRRAGDLVRYDWKGSVDKDAAALQARQQYLTTLAEQRCQPGYRPPPPPGAYVPPQAYAPPPPRQ